MWSCATPMGILPSGARADAGSMVRCEDSPRSNSNHRRWRRGSAWADGLGVLQAHSAAAGTETRRAIGSSEQAATPTTPSTFNTLKLPPSHAQTTPAAPERAPDHHIPSVQPRGSSRIHAPSPIDHNELSARRESSPLGYPCPSSCAQPATPWGLCGRPRGTRGKCAR